MKTTAIIIILVLGAAGFIYWGLQSGEIQPFLQDIENIFIESVLNCTDGTLYNQCSGDKPYYCSNGTLIKNASACGCPSDYRARGNECERIQRCVDGTIYGECASERPLYCRMGSLIMNASSCGCPADEVPQGDACISKFLVESLEQTLEYTVRGETGKISFTVYRELSNYLAGLSRYHYCDPECPSDRELELVFIDQREQKEQMQELFNEIRALTKDGDEQARIAVSLVQKIPYDSEGLEGDYLSNRYPYEVIYDEKGLCAGKSRLLAILLREFGFGVVLFRFEEEEHMAAGIKCPMEYSYNSTGYCFIETTGPSIITDDQGDYAGVGKLYSAPKTINISDGASFDSVSEEYEDSQEWLRIAEVSESSGGLLDHYDYEKWLALVEKYGIEIPE